MKKLVYVLPLAALMLVLTLQLQQTPQAKAQDEGEGECQLMDAPQIGEGWQRRVCSNSDYDSWISPSGEECFANPGQGTTRCGEGPGNPPISVD
jgi:hypothetical protein